MDTPSDDRYLAPGWFTRHVFNPTISLLTHMGISVWGSRVLSVRGRTSGEWRRVPVNLLRVDGVDFLVAPRGVTQWVRNLRVAGEGRLTLGRRTTAFTATEVPPAERPAILRPYLKRWAFEVGQFFEGVDGSATDEELLAIADDHPIFVVTMTTE